MFRLPFSEQACFEGFIGLFVSNVWQEVFQFVMGCATALHLFAKFSVDTQGLLEKFFFLGIHFVVQVCPDTVDGINHGCVLSNRGVCRSSRWSLSRHLESRLPIVFTETPSRSAISR